MLLLLHPVLVLVLLLPAAAAVAAAAAAAASAAAGAAATTATASIATATAHWLPSRHRAISVMRFAHIAWLPCPTHDNDQSPQ